MVVRKVVRTRGRPKKVMRAAAEHEEIIQMGMSRIRRRSGTRKRHMNYTAQPGR